MPEFYFRGQNIKFLFVFTNLKNLFFYVQNASFILLYEKKCQNCIFVPKIPGLFSCPKFQDLKFMDKISYLDIFMSNVEKFNFHTKNPKISFSFQNLIFNQKLQQIYFLAQISPHFP